MLLGFVQQNLLCVYKQTPFLNQNLLQAGMEKIILVNLYSRFTFFWSKASYNYFQHSDSMYVISWSPVDVLICHLIVSNIQTEYTLEFFLNYQNTKLTDLAITSFLFYPLC